MNRQEMKYQNTDDEIKNAFIELTKEKSPNKITVTEICSKTNMNRGTFYIHYESVPQLMDCLEYEYAQKLIEAVSVYHYDKQTEAFFANIFQCVKDNAELFYFYFFVSQGKGIQIFESHLQSSFLPEWMKNTDIDEFEAKLVIKFLLKGAMELLKQWYLNDFKDEDRFKEVFDRVIKHGLYDLVYLDQEE